MIFYSKLFMCGVFLLCVAAVPVRANTCQTGGKTFDASDVVWSKHHKSHLYCAGDDQWRYLAQWALAGDNNMVYSDGNVGIGNTNPSEQLVVGDDVGNLTATATTLVIGDNNPESGSRLYVAENFDNFGSFQWNNANKFWGFDTKQDGQVFHNTLAMTSGNVGIGTIDPHSRLDVKGVIQSGQNFYNILQVDEMGSSGVARHKIKTNIPFQSSQDMFTFNFNGFAYGATLGGGNGFNAAIALQLTFYIWNSQFHIPAVTSSGTWTPNVQLARENGKVVIIISPGCYHCHYTISGRGHYNRHGSQFNDWTWDDTAVTGDKLVTVPYRAIQGASVTTTGQAERICTGSTTPGVGWVGYYALDDSMYIDINTSACNFTETPKYFSNITANGVVGQYQTTGGNAPYNKTPTGFRLYVAANPAQTSTAITQRHITHGWYVEWMAVGR